MRPSAPRRQRATALALVLGLLALTAASASSRAATPDAAATLGRSQTAGPSAGLEMGRYRGGYAVALAYHQPLPIPALGVGLGVNVGVPGSDLGGTAFGGNVFMAYGRQHRAILLLGYALNDRRVLRLHGQAAVTRSLWGPEVQAGYQLVASYGAVVHVLVGTTYVPDRLLGPADRFRTTLVLALGWKFW